MNWSPLLFFFKIKMVKKKKVQIKPAIVSIIPKKDD